MMRARSRLQRFPVAQWIEDLEVLQNKSIRLHERVSQKQINPLNATRFSESGRASPSMSTAPASIAPSSAQNTAPNSASNSEPPSRAISPSREAVIPGSNGQMSLGRFFGPSHPSIVPRGRSKSASRSRSRSRHRLTSKRSASSLATRPTNAGKNHRVSMVPEGNEDAGQAPSGPALYPGTQRESGFIEEEPAQHDTLSEGFPRRFPPLPELNMAVSSPVPSGRNTPVPSGRNTPVHERPEIIRSETPLSVHSVAGEQKTFSLQRVDPFFTDEAETYYRAFQKRLESVNSKSAEDQLCIEEFLVRSEKAWFNRFHLAKMGNSAAASRSSTPASSVFRMPMHWGRGSPDVDRRDSQDPDSPVTDQSGTAQFFLGDDYVPPTGLKKVLQTKIGDWHLYCFLLAFVSTAAPCSAAFELMIPGANHRGQLVSDHPTDGREWPIRAQALHHSEYLPGGLDDLVAPLPSNPTGIPAQLALPVLWTSLLPGRHGSSYIRPRSPRLDLQRSDGILRRSLGQRLPLLRPQLRHRRWHSCPELGFPRLRHPGQSATLCGGVVVLGQHIDSLVQRRTVDQCTPDLGSYRHGHHHANRMLALGHRPCPALRSAQLLPSSPGQDPILLSRPVPP